MKKYGITFVSVFLVILLMLSNNTLVGLFNSDVNRKQLDLTSMLNTADDVVSKTSVFSQEDLVRTAEDSISQFSTLPTQEAWSDSDMDEENPLSHGDVPSPDAASEVVDSLLGANGSYQLIWEPNRVQGSVHSVAAYPIDADGNAIVAIGAGYLYDNEIHIYRWDAGAETGTHVWDVGDGVIMGDVLSLTFADSDKDGFIEIVAGCADRKIYVFEQRSAFAVNPLFNQFQLVWDSAKEVGARVTSVAVDDLDLDGFREIIAGSWSKKVYVYEYTARYGYPGTSQHRHWYAKVWDSGTTIKGLVNSIATGDTDSDDFREIAVGSSDSIVYVFENNRSVSPEPVYAHMDNAYGLVWNSSDLIPGPVQSVTVDEKRIVASSSGHGVYVFSYDKAKRDKYRMNKLIRAIETWEEAPSFPIDIYVDSKVSGNKTTGVFEPPDIPQPWSLYEEHATAMAGPPNSNYALLNATATEEGVAITILDFGKDEEITGNTGIDFYVDGLWCSWWSPVSEHVTLKNFELYVSRDNINFAKVEEGIKLSNKTEPYPMGEVKVFYTFSVDIDRTLRKERWEWFRYLKIETTTTVKVDAAYTDLLAAEADVHYVRSARALNRPVSDALVVSTGYVHGLSASTTDRLIIVGTVTGTIKVFKWYKYEYIQVWDSYRPIPLYQPGTTDYRRRLSLGTNIWSIDLLQGREFNGQTFMVVGTYPKVSFIQVYARTLEASVTWDTTPVLDRWTMSLAIADTDGDGKKEVIVGSFDNNIYTFEHVYRNTYRRAWRSPDLKHNETVWDHVNDLVLGDIDQDGSMEIIAATDNQTYPMIHIFENIGNDQYTAVEGIELPVNSGPISALALGNDLDNDGAVELLVADKNNLYLFEIKDTTLTSDIIYSIDPTIGTWEAQAIVTDDTDQDNYGEIIIGGNVQSYWAERWGFVQILENYGNETVSHLDNKFAQVWLAPADHVGFDYPVFSVILGDQDEDGRIEIIVGHEKGINVYENTGNDAYETAHVLTSSATYPPIQLNLVTETTPPNERIDHCPAIMQLKNGTFMTAYEKSTKDPATGRLVNSYIYTSTSSDGVIWSPGTRISEDIGIFELQPSIIEYPDGTIWIAYIKRPEEIYVVSNDGTGWTPPHWLNEHGGLGSGAYSRPSIFHYIRGPAILGGWNLSVSWIGEDGGLYIAYYTEGNWIGYVASVYPFRGFDPDHPKMISLKDGSFALVFDGWNKTSTKDDDDVFIMFSNDTVNWSSPLKVTIGLDADEYPSIIQMDDESLIVIYQMSKHLQFYIYAVASTNKGISWGKPQILKIAASTITARFPTIARLNDGGLIYAYVSYDGTQVYSIKVGVNPVYGWWSTTIGPVSCLALGDTDNDGHKEIIAGSGKNVYIFELNTTTQHYSQVWTSQELAATITDIATGDIDNDGMDEIVVTAARGNVYAFKWIKEET